MLLLLCLEASEALLPETRPPLEAEEALPSLRWEERRI